MNILVIGSLENVEECRLKFGDAHVYQHAPEQQSAEKNFPTSHVIFDFNIHQDPAQMEVYRDHPQVTAFLNSSFISVQELASEVEHEIKAALFGFCGLPTFLNRAVLEVSVYRQSDHDKLVQLLGELKTDFEVVQDRPGLVTPRIISMIINEAYYTVQEGTASREDIDLGMKLGTNYPFGPFEWAAKIGVKNVYDLLTAVYEDTKDERYKICSLLKRESLYVAS